MSGDAEPGGTRDDVNMAPDAPGLDNDTPAGMELTFQTPTTEGAVHDDDPVVPEMVYNPGEDPYQEPKQTAFEAPPAPEARRAFEGVPGRRDDRQQPKQFRQEFDGLMKKLEDRFQNERLDLEEKHSRELEEAMGYFSLSSNEREAKQQELQAALLEDIGNMAQQLHELTGTLGTEGDQESLTIPSDPKVLEEYARKMQDLEDQFQREKEELEHKHANDMEQALGTLKLSREQREAKQLELQDQLTGELGDMAKQLEELNQAKAAYEAKMGVIKQQLSKEEPYEKPPDRKLQSMNRRLGDVERERDAAQDELRRLKLALQVTKGDAAGGPIGDLFRGHLPGSSSHRDRLSPQDQNNISSLRGRIEQIERELKEAAQTPGGSDTMQGLRVRMKRIENDLEAAEESTKEHFALEHLRARMEKVERLLAEGERAAQDWEALEELRNKIGNVDSDLKAVEEAKKEFEALEALRSKMESVESELKIAEQLATDRENVERLRQRLGQVERELGVAEPARQEPTSVDKLLDRLAKAESSLQDARDSTPIPLVASRESQKAERDDEVEKILQRLALAESKLNAAKESAQRRNPNTSSGYPNLPVQKEQPSGSQPTPFDERQAKIRARLQEHFDESDPSVKKENDRDNHEKQQQQQQPPPPQVGVQAQHSFNRQGFEGGPSSRFEEPRTIGYVQDVPLHRDVLPRAKTFDSALPRPTSYDYETIHTQEPASLDTFQGKFDSALPGTARPLRRRHAGETSHEPFRRDQDKDGLGGAATRPLRRRYPGEEPQSLSRQLKPETTILQSASMPYSVLGEDEDRYDAELEELRYQRALLSQKLPKNRIDEEEEKKSDDSEPQYSFKDVIRNEEKQRLRERMNPRLKKPLREPKVMADPKEVVDQAADGDPENPSSPPAEEIVTAVTSQLEEEPEENQSLKTGVSTKTGASLKTGEDPPLNAAKKAVTGDPPSQVPTLENQLKLRLQTQTIHSGRDPHPGHGHDEQVKIRTSLGDPPAHIDPPIRLPSPPPPKKSQSLQSKKALVQSKDPSVRSTPSVRSSPSAQSKSVSSTPSDGIAQIEHPSDEKSQGKSPGKEHKMTIEESTFSSEVSSKASSIGKPDASVRTPVSVASRPESRRSSKQLSPSKLSVESGLSASSPKQYPPPPPPRPPRPPKSVDPSPMSSSQQEPPAHKPPTPPSHKPPPPPPPPPRPPRPPPVPQPPASPASDMSQSEDFPSQYSRPTFTQDPEPQQYPSATTQRLTLPLPPTHPPSPPTPQPVQPPPPVPTVAPATQPQLPMQLQAPPQLAPPQLQQPIFHQTTVVDGKAAARERREKDRLMRWVVLILLCIAIILAVVIIVVIVLLRDNDPVPTPAPTFPSKTMGPNITMAPTMAPTMNGTMPPPFFGCPELRDNRPLIADGVTRNEDTIGVVFDASSYGPCGNIFQPGDNGVWYVLIGQGEVVTVSTCTLFFPSFDTQLLIYTPTNQSQGCQGGLDCVASNDNFCGLQSSVTFIAQDDTFYFIYISGLTYAPAEGLTETEGEFSLTVSTSPEGSCLGAYDLEISPAHLLEVIVVGQLLGGTFGVDPCTPETDTRTGELWYRVLGTGQEVIAKTCHAVSLVSTQLAVYRGSCEDLICESNECVDCGNGSEISWYAALGEVYYLLVYSPEPVPEVTFGVSVQAVA